MCSCSDLLQDKCSAAACRLHYVSENSGHSSLKLTAERCSCIKSSIQRQFVCIFQLLDSVGAKSGIEALIKALLESLQKIAAQNENFYNIIAESLLQHSEADLNHVCKNMDLYE